MSAKIHPLADAQAEAVDPRDTVWLSASAGTGKTQVLSARVLRLLLEPHVSPSEILCLTFTKAGAAEMAERVNGVLARWVRLDDAALAKELGDIGADIGKATIARARTRFAAVLDCPGGGLRIDTIHAFATWLLSAFPHEAGLQPGLRAMEEREADLLARELLADLLLDAERGGRTETLDALAALSLRFGPDGAEWFLRRCAVAHEAWQGPRSFVPPLRPRLLGLLGLPSDASRETLAAMCGDDRFPSDRLRHCRAILRAWGTKTGTGGAEAIDTWLAADPAERIETLGSFRGTVLTKDGKPARIANILKVDDTYGPAIDDVCEALEEVEGALLLLDLADWLAPALELGREYALAWEAAKQREGLINFDDQIRLAARLLTRADVADWIRFKLDRRFDHILVDEAQDTNAAQWQIILDGLAQEFWTGAGQHGLETRTLFVVGDYKQAIFGFQGTSPENFRKARDVVRNRMAAYRDAWEAANPRGDASAGPRGLRELGLGRSFRSAKSILHFVDRAIAAIGPERIGLRPQDFEAHEGEDRPSTIGLWRPIGMEEDEETAEGPDGEGGGDWLQPSDRRLASRIARQVRGMLEGGFPLHKDKGSGPPRAAGPGDVMVLVRRRKDLAGLIVARLHEEGVAVAGVDRLRLGDPLAVQDLLAALRFAAQPLDDLNLAALLVSPLVGWSQEQLLEHGYREGHVRLWEHLRSSSHPDVLALRDHLRGLLERSDFEPPQRILHWLLTGPWQTRRKLVARLGREANDPIDELLNAAHAYAAAQIPSLTGFLHWLDAGEGELKREAGKAGEQVRVMTVHGAKGLQAPIVILADAADNPHRSRGNPLTLSESGPGREDAPELPMPAIPSDQRAGPLAAAKEAAEAEMLREHWRLLYVGMTRAEEALFVTGSLGAREKEPHDDSWYKRLESLFDPEGWTEDARGDPVNLIGGPGEYLGKRERREDEGIERPDWLGKPVGPEPRPPRPLAPSSLGEDDAPDPPLPSGEASLAARRGTLIHRLLERLPEVARDEREARALAWLAAQASDVDPATREEIVASTLGVLDDPQYSDLFGPNALAEVPIAATIGGNVIAGTVDRLLIEDGRILVVDFKTTRRPPSTLEDIPRSTVRQMAAYAASLRGIYPDRDVEAAVLYTHAPRLVALPAQLLESEGPQARLARQEG